jgi:hypothetical protein
MGRMTKYILVRKSEAKRPFWRPTHRSEDNIKMILQKYSVCGRDWSGSWYGPLADLRECLGVNERWEISWIAERLLACRQEFCSMKLCCASAEVLMSYPLPAAFIYWGSVSSPTWVLLLDGANCNYKVYSPMASIVSEEFEGNKFVAFQTMG